MGYIEDLRRLVGHRPLLLVGAGVLITDHDGRLLLLRRTDNHCWGIPGGALEPGESLEDTARRETLEETGLKLEQLALFGLYSGPELFYRYPNGDEVYNISADFTAALPAGSEIHLNPEHSQAAFFDLQHLPEPISPPLRRLISDFCLSHADHQP
jgi:8-oxo-dGTP pyrophosphatase MutT (NUDIX family)